MKYILILLFVCVCHSFAQKLEIAKPAPAKPEPVKPEPVKPAPEKPASTKPEKAEPEKAESEEPETGETEEAAGVQREYLKQTFDSIFKELKPSIKDPQVYEIKRKNYTVSGISNVALTENPTFRIRRRGNREIVGIKFTVGPVVIKGENITIPLEATPTGHAQIRIVKKESGEVSVAVNNLKFDTLSRKDLGLQAKARDEFGPKLSIVRQIFGKRHFQKDFSEILQTHVSNEINKEKLANIPRP